MKTFPTLPLDPSNEFHLEWLDSIQGNIVKGHGRKHVRLVFFRFGKTQRRNLDLLPAAVGAELVTSARKQLEQKRAGPDEPFFSLALTQEFFRACDFAAGLPPESMGRAFLSGAGNRLGGSENWDAEYQRSPHGMWLLAHRSADQLDAMQGRVAQLLGTFGAQIHGTEENGFRWSDDPEGKTLREPFGFRDGISTTDYFSAPSKTAPEANVALERLLIAEPHHAGGSFMVLLKLDQNVRAFRAFEHRLAEAYKGRPPAQDAGALLVGRNRDGTPLADFDPQKPNHFDFKADRSGDRCPFHAHIRKANPRDTGAHVSKDSTEILGSQFVRRSVVYDEEGQLPESSAPDYQAGDQITGKVGLLFMGYMRHIEEQFERMHKVWFDDPTFPTLATGQSDPIIQPHDSPPEEWSWGETTVRGMTRFVTARGGAYFYVPAMTWLRNPAAPPGPARQE